MSIRSVEIEEGSEKNSPILRRSYSSSHYSPYLQEEFPLHHFPLSIPMGVTNHSRFHQPYGLICSPHPSAVTYQSSSLSNHPGSSSVCDVCHHSAEVLPMHHYSPSPTLRSISGGVSAAPMVEWCGDCGKQDVGPPCKCTNEGESNSLPYWGYEDSPRNVICSPGHCGVNPAPLAGQLPGPSSDCVVSVRDLFHFVPGHERTNCKTQIAQCKMHKRIYTKKAQK